VPCLKGKKAFLWGKASPLYDSKGNIAGVIESIRDMTERKVAEERLQESERRLADIIDFLPDATLAIDLKGKVIAWNRAIEEMTGVKAKDMLGKGNYEYVIPFYGERRPVLINLVLNPNKKIEKHYSVLNKRKDLFIVETWAPCLKGKGAFLWGKASPLYDGKGNIVGAIESVRDITERKRNEETLKKREEDLELKTSELQDLNAALRVLLKQREGDRSELEDKILSNVKLLVNPFIEKLKRQTDPKGHSYVNIIESNLKDIISPFSHKLSTQYRNLTNKEIQVAHLIREGKTTKEIAEILNVSESAVNVHRFHVRKKLGLTKLQNLRSYLSSLT
jgi:PAS domain S-box-containing protein